MASKKRKYESVNIDNLMPYINNTKIHSKEQIQKIQGSIREFGFVNPLLIDGNYNIIAGHGRLAGAKAEGLKEVPCLFIEDLTDAQIKAYRIADNKIAELAEWDFEMLEIELDSIGIDFKILGFEASEIDILDSIESLEDVLSEYEPPKKEECQCPQCSYKSAKKEFVVK